MDNELHHKSEQNISCIFIKTVALKKHLEHLTLKAMHFFLIRVSLGILHGTVIATNVYCFSPLCSEQSNSCHCKWPGDVGACCTAVYTRTVDSSNMIPYTSLNS